mgnify:CR=1 FL=1
MNCTCTPLSNILFTLSSACVYVCLFETYANIAFFFNQKIGIYLQYCADMFLKVISDEESFT